MPTFSKKGSRPMIADIEINKPAPIALGDEPHPFNKESDVTATIALLEAGEQVLVTDYYSNGTELLQEVNKYLNKKFANKSFKEQRVFRAEYRRLSNLILVEVADQKLAVGKAPVIGWLEQFYTTDERFYLTFPQVQGLNSSWQWHKNGISIPVLRNKLHPYYGTYFPTRFEHLILFDNWLKRYEGPKKSAMDVGIGSGVLSLQMVQHRFQKVFGTDINPNAIAGLKEFMGTTKLSRKIELDFASLFGKWQKPTELIVFNPPWLPVDRKLDRLDEAVYYNRGLFRAFFEGAKERLLPEGKLLVIFSNLAQITGVSKVHPVEQELEKGGRFQLERCFKKKVKAASSKTKRNQSWRDEEEVELWVLVHQ